MAEERTIMCSRPKLSAIKNTYELINSRIEAIIADGACKTNCPSYKYLYRMLKFRRRIERLLQTYPCFCPPPKKIDPACIVLPPELVCSCKKLSSPHKKVVKDTLKTVNYLIRRVIDDRQYKKDPLKVHRVKELLQLRNQVCCLYSKYHKSPKPSIECMPFKRCGLKCAPVYEVYNAVCNPKPFRSRVLEFMFDEDTNQLALPSLRRIKEALTFYSKLCNEFHLQMKIEKHPEETKVKIQKVICDVINRISVLSALKKEAECRENIHDCQVSKKTRKALLTFKQLYPDERSKICYGLPLRRKLVETLSFQRDLLKKVPEPPKSDKKKSKFRTYKQSVEKHIAFMEKVIKTCYPKAAKLHCKPPPEEKHRFKPKEIKPTTVNITPKKGGKFTKSYEFDNSTQDLALPKLDRMLEACNTHQQFLGKFTTNIELSEALKRKIPEKSKPDFELKLKVIPTPRQVKAEKEIQFAAATKKEHDELNARIERLCMRIQEKTEKLENLKAAPTKHGFSSFYHHIVCDAVQAVDCPYEYQMKGPHTSIFSSQAPKRRLIDALDKYRFFINSKCPDLEFKRQLDAITNDVNEEDQNEGDQSHYRPHTVRFLDNMNKLEKLLNDMEPPEFDCHAKSHKNFESENEFVMKTGGVFDEQRMIELAKAKKAYLRHTLESFQEFMSCEKKKRLECELGKTAVSPETLEAMMRKPPSRPSCKNVRDDTIKLLRQIEKKVAGDVYDEIAAKLQKKLPKMLLNRIEPTMVTSNLLKLQNTALDIINCTNGLPQCGCDLEQYKSFSGVVADFVMNTMVDSITERHYRQPNCVRPMHAEVKNQELIEIANNLIRKINAET